MWKTNVVSADTKSKCLTVQLKIRILLYDSKTWKVDQDMTKKQTRQEPIETTVKRGNGTGLDIGREMNYSEHHVTITTDLNLCIIKNYIHF
jgi:hypothetical protein